VTTTLKRITPGSAFKVGVVVNGILFLIAGIFIFILPTVAFTSMSASISGSGISDADIRAMNDIIGLVGGASMICFYFVGVVMSAIIGGIYFAIAAVIYNLTAKWVGGLEIELQFAHTGYLDEIERDINAAEKRKNTL